MWRVLRFSIVGCIAITLAGVGRADDALVAMDPADVVARAAAMARLRDPAANDAAVVEACKTLRRLGPDASTAVNDLVAALGRSRPVRGAAGDALRAIGPRAVPALVAGLARKDNPQRRLMADLLGHMGRDARGAVEPLRQLLDPGDKETCLLVCHVLQDLGPVAAPAARDVVKLVASDDADLRLAASDAIAAIARGRTDPTADQMFAVARGMDDLRRHSGDEVALRKVCKQLGDVGPAANNALPALIHLAISSDALRSDAMAAVKSIGTDLVISPLLDAIRSGDEKEAHAAIQILASLGDRAAPAVEPLQRMLHSGMPAAYRACVALGELGPLAKASLSDLQEKIRSSSSISARRVATEAIARIDPETNAVLVAALTDNKHPFERNISRALDEVRAQGSAARGAIPTVSVLLLDGSAVVRLHALAALDQITPSSPREFAALRLAYREAEDFPDREISDKVRLAVLGRCLHGDPSGHSIKLELSKAMREDDLSDFAATLIASSGRAAAPLTDVLLPLMYEQGLTQLGALKALTGIAPGIQDRQAVVDAVLPLLDASEASVRLNGALLLGALGTSAEPGVLKLTKMLDSDDAAEVAAAAQALGQIGKPALSALPALARQVARRMSQAARDASDANVAARGACTEALARLDPESPQASDLLLQAVKHKDWVVRECLAPALAKARNNHSELVPDLTALAERAPDELVRVNARCALREIGAEVPDSSK